jgi:chaperonin cofactor prefoldin
MRFLKELANAIKTFVYYSDIVDQLTTRVSNLEIQVAYYEAENRILRRRIDNHSHGSIEDHAPRYNTIEQLIRPGG